MDQLAQLTSFTLLYFVASHLNTKTKATPKSLSEKERLEYLSQFPSKIHAYASLTLALIVYWLEGGVQYTSPTNHLHVFVLSVIST